MMMCVSKGSNQEYISKLCSGCRATKELDDFDFNKKGVCFKTCNLCRARNKNKTKATGKETPASVANSDLTLSVTTKNDFIRTILNYLPGEKLKFLRGDDVINDSGVLKLIFTKRRSMILVRSDDKWGDIKKLIDNELAFKTSRECSICCEPYAYAHDMTIDMFPRIGCRTCVNDWCMECHFNILNKNRGVITCPYCRDTVDYPVGGCQDCLEEYISFLTYSLAACRYENIPFGFSRSM